MQTPQSLAPEDLLSVSPVVAQVVADLFATHPSLATVPEVQLAILGVTSRYVRQLRDAVAPAPKLGGAEVRRALMFLMNTQRPLPSAPEATAADLFVAATNKLLGSSSYRARNSAVRALEYAVACIVHVARTTRARGCSTVQP